MTDEKIVIELREKIKSLKLENEKYRIKNLKLEEMIAKLHTILNIDILK